MEVETLQTASQGNEEVVSSETSVLELLVKLNSGRRAIFFASVGAAVLGTIVSLIIPNRYTATAKMLPPQQNQSMVTSLAGQLGSLSTLASLAQGSGSFGLKNSGDTFVEILKSRRVADELIRRFELLKVYSDKRMSDCRKDLEHATRIELGKRGFINISVEDKDPKRAADIANGYIEELRKVTQTLAVTEAGQRRMFFEQQLEQAKNSLADAEEELRRTQEVTGIIQLDGQAKAIIDSVVKLRAQIAAREIQLRGMRMFSTEQNPDILLLEQQLGGMRSQLANMEAQSGDQAGIQVPTGRVPQAGLQYVRKMREVKYHETIFELLAKQFEAAKLDEARSTAIIQVLDPAIEPDRKSSPKRIIIILLATLAGFLGSVWYVLSAKRGKGFIAELRRRLGVREWPSASVSNPA